MDFTSWVSVICSGSPERDSRSSVNIFWGFTVIGWAQGLEEQDAREMSRGIRARETKSWGAHKIPSNPDSHNLWHLALLPEPSHMRKDALCLHVNFMARLMPQEAINGQECGGLDLGVLGFPG